MKPRTPMVRESDTTTPALRASDLRHAAQRVDTLLAEHSGEELVHVEVELLRRYREGVRAELFGELEAEGRLRDLEELTPRELDLMDHALGAGRGGRNYFVADQEGDDARAWSGLEARGLATSEPYPLAPSAVLYRVTPAGQTALRAYRRAA